MGKVEIIMPKMGESVAEATIIKWLKQEGDAIEAEEAVLEIATDKVDSEIPSPEEGVLLQQMFPFFFQPFCHDFWTLAPDSAVT